MATEEMAAFFTAWFLRRLSDIVADCAGQTVVIKPVYVEEHTLAWLYLRLAAHLQEMPSELASKARAEFGLTRTRLYSRCAFLHGVN